MENKNKDLEYFEEWYKKSCYPCETWQTSDAWHPCNPSQTSNSWDNYSLQELKMAWETMFSFEFEKNEYVELIYDNGGDRRYFNAVHVKTFDELLEFVKKKSGKCNISICPNTRKPINGLHRRTGSNAILRQKAVLINVKDRNYHDMIGQYEAKRMIDEVRQSMPKPIREAVRWTAYTGRSGLICLLFDRPMNSDEIPIVYKHLKSVLKGIEYIDEHSFTPAQAFTLVGTVCVS